MSATASSASFAASASANAFAPRFSTRETVYAEGVPRMVLPELSDLAMVHARYHARHENDRVLVHRLMVAPQSQRYTVDYITTQILGVWHEYTVVYTEGTTSPFPHTVDLRLGPVENAPAQAQQTPCSSAGFRATAMAMIQARRASAASAAASSSS